MRDKITRDKRQTDFPSEDEIMTMIPSDSLHILTREGGEVGINETSMVVYHFNHIVSQARSTNHFQEAR